VDVFRDGVWWIDLAALEDERLIPSKVARTLGIPEGAGGPVTDTIIGHLRTSQALLVLDNCEHLLGACAQLITALLTSCPDLKVLVTSREALGVFGERVWLAPAMLLPEEGALPTVNDLERFDAIRLFLERAAATGRGLKLDERNAKTLISICRKLDGIPLAIEMAAARAAALPLQEIARRLEERFSLLITGDRVALPRQQTLRATMDWSYNMLSTDAQRLLCELSVFAGGFTVEAAENVCVAEGGQQTVVVNLLSNLVSKSLVAMETTSGDARFRMLETIREYARAKSEMTGGRDAVQRRHLDFFLALAEKSVPVGLWGAAKPIWLGELEADQDNLRAALQYSSEYGLTEQHLRLCAALTWFWFIRSESIEGRNWLVQALTSSAAQSVSPSLRAEVLHNAGVFAYLQGDWEKALELLEESRSLCERLQDVRQLGWIRHDLGQVAFFQGDYSLAAQQAAQGLDLFEQINDSGGVASMKLYLGLIAYYQGDNPRARTLLEESLLGLHEIGDDVAEARVLHGLALVEHQEGNDDRAAALFSESLLKARYKRDQLDVIKALEGLGWVACTQGRTVQSATLLGAADALRSRINYPLEPGARRENDRTIAALREKLDAGAFARAWEEGAALAFEAAVELLLQSKDA
jgi:non-specific serine/threonine protein kinase